MLVILSFLTISPQDLYAKWDVLDTLKGHTDNVNSVAFSADGQILASGSHDGTVILWDPLTGKKIKTLTGHNDSVYSVAFNSDGLLASASLDGTIILWDSITGEKYRILQHSGVRCVAFSPDGQILASGSQFRTVKLWHMYTSVQLQQISNHEKDVTSVAFSLDGMLLASVSYDSTVRLWDLRKQKLAKTLESPSIYVYSVTFISDIQLAVGLQDGAIKLWNFTKETGIGVKVLRGHQSHVRSVAFSPKNQLLASGSRDGIIKLWYPKTGAELVTLEEHRGPVNSVAFSPDGSLLASGSDDGTIKLWQVNSMLSLWQVSVLSVHIKNEDTFPKTINQDELLLEFTTEPQSVRYSYNLDDKGWIELPEEKNSVLLRSLKDGEHRFEVKATSKIWDINSTPDSIIFTVDSHPNTKITSKKMNKDTIIFQFTGVDAQTETMKLRYQWRVNGGDWSKISKENTVTIPLKQLSIGEHVFEARAIDDEGKLDPIPAKELFIVTIPEQQVSQIIITNPPTEAIKSNTYTFYFDRENSQTLKDKLQYSWRLDGSPWSECSTKTEAKLTNLSASWHLFEVKAINTDNNDDPTPAEASFEVEEQFPETFIAKMPKSPVKTASITFQFFGRDLQTPMDKLRYSWHVDGEFWSHPSTKTIAVLTDLSNGRHLFEVKAIDTNGNEDPTPVGERFEVLIEEQFPDTKIIDYPKDIVKTPYVMFKFIGIDLQTETNQLKYSWRIDFNPWSELTKETMVLYNQNLSKGSHWFEVKAIDADGNGDPTPDKKLFAVVDIEGKFPETQIIQPSENDVLETEDVTFHFTGGDNQNSTKKLQYSWRTDKEENWAIPSTQRTVTRSFPDGRHWFQVKAIADGNEDPTPAKVWFIVDTQRNVPDTWIVNPPGNPIKTSDFIFQFTGKDPQTPYNQLLYSWRVDQGYWSAPSPDTKAYINDLSNGLHRFEVKAIDGDGNEDSTPARADFQVTIDKKLPNTKITITISKPIYTADFEIPFEGIDPQAPADRLRYSWRVDDKLWSEPSLDMKAPLKDLSDGWHIFEVRAVDADGNEDPVPASIRFMVDTKRQYPETEIISAPQKTIETADVTIRFRGKDLQTPAENLRYSWRLVGKTWSEPSEEAIARLTGLSDGSYWFQVKAVDTDDNEDPMPAEAKFEVAIDKKFPDTQIILGTREGPITKSDVKIYFTGNDSKTPTEQLRYSWRLDNNENWYIPSSETMVHLKNLSNGQHYFQVKAIDEEGNEDPTPAVVLLRVVVPPFYKHPIFLVITVASFVILFSVILAVRYARQSHEFREVFNPYQAGEPIIEPEKFYGRTAEINKIKSMLQSGSVIVCGERRIGKTSVLRQIERTVDGKFIPCFVQLGDATEDTFFRKIGKGIAIGCNKVGILTNDLLIENQQDRYDGLDLRDDIKRIVDRMRKADQEEKLLVIIDEVDVTNSFPGYIQESIRAIAQDFTQSLKFLVAGTYIEEAEGDVLFRVRPSAWYNAFYHIEIEPLGEKEARELIEKPVGKAYQYSSKAVNFILAQSLMRPYVIQLICYHIIEHMKVRGKTRIKLKDAEMAFAESVKQFDVHLKNLSAHLPEQIQKAFKTQGYLEYTEDNDFIDLLEKEGVVWHDGLNTWRPSPIFEEWIRRNQR